MRPTRLRGARTHNLRGIDLDLEPGTLVAIAGPSGAGKSSLAFGTLYAEGQRRYVESFSAYARQFLERLSRPDVDELDPVPAAIAVDRQAPVRTSRSTVGTMTEVADYAKTLWARAALLECPGCGEQVERDAPGPAVEQILAQMPGERVVVTYPVEVVNPENYLSVREGLLEQGYRRAWFGNGSRDLDDLKPSEACAQGDGLLHVVADRTVAQVAERSRLVEALEAAMRLGAGRAAVRGASKETLRFSSALHCAQCDRFFRDSTPALFSFNNPIGACERCRGFGRTIGVDFDRVIPDRTLSLTDGAIRAWLGKATTWERRGLKKRAKRAGVPMDMPVEQFSADQWSWLIEGDGTDWPDGWPGLLGWFNWLETKSYKMHVRVFLSRYRKYEKCQSCSGTRLKAEALQWKIDRMDLPAFYALPVDRALAFVRSLKPRFACDPATEMVLGECESRLRMLEEVGLPYLTLDRASRTLSGGEAQRVALTSSLGASLTGAMFVLDEPTVGLHPRDVERLHRVVCDLSNEDNIVVVVEHDRRMILGSDRVIELGPGAGEKGGRIVFDGTPSGLLRGRTRTGKALGPLRASDRKRRAPTRFLELSGASGHNLKGVDLRVPKGALTCVTGVSGSGKSSLVMETLCPAVARVLGEGSPEPALPFIALKGVESLSSVVRIDQAPLGRTSRGNPATYLKAWDVIRKRFVAEPLAKARGYRPGMFSFNVEGGRCEACKGEGAETVEMQFLADVTFSCPNCGGRRFVGQILDVKHRGLDIADVLRLTAHEALAHFQGDALLEARLAPLRDVGIAYLRLGQPLNTLSGGEAQRLKLAQALAGAAPGSLLVLDEPTVGLHADDVAPLLLVLDRLVERGDTVVVVEHDMQVVAHADHVVELGPGPGEAGGRVVATGTPEELAGAESAPSAPFLAHALGEDARHSGPGTGRRRAAKRRAEGQSDFPSIDITGAREHNLKDLSVRIPREKLVVVTGPSGSGKSTLAFDVVYAEGQRRYLETLSPYARQYMPQLPRPHVDRVIGVPPSVSLEQRTTRGGANSTVATVTEVAHYLRLLYARVGLLHCPDCQVPIAPRQPAMLAQDLRMRFRKGARIEVLAPVVRAKKGIHREVLSRAVKEGVVEARIDGEMQKIEPRRALDRYKEHDIELLVARIRLDAEGLESTLERALQMAHGTARVICGVDEILLSSRRACPSCGTGFPELDPRFFSFNTRQGGCDACEGKGLVVRRRGRGKGAREEEVLCGACDGSRLSGLARSVTVDGRPITELMRLSVGDAQRELRRIRLTGRDAEVGRTPKDEALRRMAFLERVGLGYLGLDRGAATLSGGELQRVRLAAQLGSGLTGVLYVLDEPTIGLHPRDTETLIGALRELVEKGNSVLVVEHDADTIRAADHVVDVGPGGGRHGGAIVAQGAPAEILANPASVTGAALARPASLPGRRRFTRGGDWLCLRGAALHNLKHVDLKVPLGCLVAVTGVSGSGKSTLIREVLLRAIRAELGLVAEPAGPFDTIEGMESLSRAVEIDQSPIGRTPRSVPATYVGIWDHLRKLLAATPEARARGYSASRFSFNVKDGRCPDCEGQGALSVEMSFLPQVLVLCESCDGRRFNRETLDIRLYGLSAAGILDADVVEAAELFNAIPKVARPLSLLEELGLGYLKLGQASNTLSGGEAQRLKLVSELASTAAGSTLYVMDEPTTGLHRDDVARLLKVLNHLVERGDTVVVIEHQPDVILAADHVIDLGPEGGARGGRIVAAGTPEHIIKSRRSHTGTVLAREVGRSL